MRLKILLAAAMSASAALSVPLARADTCGLCAKEVLLNAELAKCLLGQYASLSQRSAGAIAVDLTGCETSRGIVDALPSVTPAVEEPDLQFIVSRTQLECLKSRLEVPGLVQDPLTKIDLRTC